ncbi:hypothetical protein MJG53_003134 [Ovis ammon polii x Ovis aries]|uniref:Uncharacterized protein n=1 Tax=Ovis ammon polii x Ovis aries TaxID=2918886 RepID=A0ACB9VGY9_9CETA|nr:hypothetical protein MJT46_004485 [Ovis ammon polii x Ovis aries]KAI4588726.1 hypothetical protein MJG53_003134 [Ovis ammon polii x Ovis aries]
MVARRWSSRLSCGEHLLLRRDRNAQNSFLNKQRKYPSSRATRRKRGSSGCGRDPRASSRGETGENVLDFLKLWLILSSYDGDERDRLWWPQDWNAQDSLLNKQRKDPSSRPTRRKRSSSGCGRDPRASSQVERGMSGNFLSCIKGVKDPLEVPEERPGFSSEQAAKGSLISTYEAETELFWMWAGPTCFLSSGEGAVPRATVVGIDPRRESRGSAEKEVPLEWTETSRGLLEWWHDDGVPLAFAVESASSEVRREYREFFPDQAAKGSLISIYEAETGLLWMGPGLSCFL